MIKPTSTTLLLLLLVHFVSDWPFELIVAVDFSSVSRNSSILLIDTNPSEISATPIERNKGLNIRGI